MRMRKCCTCWFDATSRRCVLGTRHGAATLYFMARTELAVRPFVFPILSDRGIGGAALVGFRERKSPRR
eukprot:1438554-Pyramimonas_sp.AAC.1